MKVNILSLTLNFNYLSKYKEDPHTVWNKGDLDSGIKIKTSKFA